MSHVLQNIVAAWQSVIGRARDRKHEEFGRQADDAYHFYAAADHSVLYTQAYMQHSMGLSAAQVSEVDFKATVNLTGNAVNVFLPVLCNRNPIRTVNPKRCSFNNELIGNALASLGISMPPIGETPDERWLHRRVRAMLFGHYLNVTPQELNLKEDHRLSVLEAFVKGDGIIWATAHKRSDGTRLVGLEHDSIDYLLIDPDAERLLHAGFIVRRRCEPTWQIERKFDLPAGTLKNCGDTMSGAGGADLGKSADYAKLINAENEENKACDAMTYYEVYSRIGIGHRLKQTPISEADDGMREALDALGENVYLAIPSSASNYPCPLNLPKEVFAKLAEQSLDEAGWNETAQLIKRRIAWPVPAYEDLAYPWPCRMLGFHPLAKTPWHKSHMTDSMGIQKAIDWILSFLIGRIKITSRALIAVPTGLGKEITDKILYGRDLELLEIDNKHTGTLDQLCAFIKMPEVNGEIGQLLQMLKMEFEDSTGVTELNMSARTSVQMRSAEEARMKRDILSVRPQDMAMAVEEWLSSCARLEAGAAASNLVEDDIARVFLEPKPSEVLASMAESGLPTEGETGRGPYTALWMELIADEPLDRMFSELEFTIESGSAARADYDSMRNTVDESAQILVEKMWALYQQTGDPTQFNSWITDYYKSRNWPDYETKLFPDMRQQMAAQQQAAQMGPPPQDPNTGGPPPDAMPSDSSGSMPEPPATDIPALLEQMLAAGQGGPPMPPLNEMGGEQLDPMLTGAM